MAPINIAQLVALVEEKGPQILLPHNLPEKWLQRLSGAAVEARRRQQTPPLAIRVAVLSIRERRAVKEREIPKREKKYNPSDLEEWILLYSRDLEWEAIRRQGGGDKLKADPAFQRLTDNPPGIEN